MYIFCIMSACHLSFDRYRVVSLAWHLAYRYQGVASACHLSYRYLEMSRLLSCPDESCRFSVGVMQVPTSHKWLSGVEGCQPVGVKRLPPPDINARLELVAIAARQAWRWCHRLQHQTWRWCFWVQSHAASSKSVDGHQRRWRPCRLEQSFAAGGRAMGMSAIGATSPTGEKIMSKHVRKKMTKMSLKKLEPSWIVFRRVWHEKVCGFAFNVEIKSELKVLLCGARSFTRSLWMVSVTRCVQIAKKSNFIHT